MSHPLRIALLTAIASIAFISHAEARTPGGYDDRWYITAGAGANHQDNKRDTENTAFGTIGVGKFINPNWSIDTELNYQNPKANRNEDLNFSQYGISFDARRHFRQEGRRINPYIVGGVGYQRAEEEYSTLTSPAKDKRGYATAKVGVGAQADFQRVSVRGEVFARRSFDGDSLVAPNRSGFTDTLAQLSVVIPLGAEHVVAQATPAPLVVAPPAISCSELDSDNDGVNDCNDKCPSSQVGQAVGPDGCAVPLTIDLRGVNFQFNSDKLNPSSTQILDEAIKILEQHPELKVEVAGHTDSIGSEAYNQRLSEKRASAVYDYLINRGISSSRLSGPNGYGETQPIAPNRNADGSDNPEGRALNRRTELRSGH